MLSETRVGELLDYATVYGEFDESTPNGTQCKYGESFASPMSDLRRVAIIAYKRVLGLLPEDYAFPGPSKPLIIELIDFQGARPAGDGRWRWRTRCPENGNILAQSSEHYHNRADCEAMIHRHFGAYVEIVEVQG